MSEITKLYENAGVKKLLCCDICNAQEHALGLCAETKCEPFYPPFTSEKQLELIKWMIKTSHKYLLQNIIVECFSESLAGILNIYWSSLTEEEKQQVKGILE